MKQNNPKKLGIMVTTSNTIKHVLGIAGAIEKTGKRLELFLTGEGVALSQHPQFKKVLKRAKVSICEFSFIDRGYKKEDMEELHDKDFVIQMKNAELIQQCDRYIVL